MHITYSGEEAAALHERLVSKLGIKSDRRTVSDKTLKRIEIAKRLYQDNWDTGQIADYFSVSRQQARTYLRQGGVKLK